MGSTPILIWVVMGGVAALPFTDSPVPLFVASGAAAILTARSFRALGTVAQLLVVFCIVATITGVMLDKLSWAHFWISIQRGLTLSGFIFTLGILGFAGSRSRLVAQVGANLARQPPGKRYWALCLGSSLMGPMLSLGVINLLNSAVQNNLRQSGGDISDKAHCIITRRTATAIMRGMGLVPLWSPVSIIIILVGTRIPDLGWMDYLPLGLATALAMMVLGWWIDQRTFLGVKANFDYQRGFHWRGLMLLTLILSIVPIVAWGLSLLLPIPFTTGLTYAFVISGLGWVICQELSGRDAQVPMHRLRRAAAALNTRLGHSANEATVLLAAGALSGLVFPLMDVEAISMAVDGIDLPAEILLTGAVVMMVALSMIGLNIVATGAIVLDIFLTASSLEVAQSLLILSVTVAFAISTVVSPVGVGVLLTARETRVSADKVAYQWNALYGLLALVLFGTIAIFSI